MLYIILSLYFVLISVISITVTIVDKINAVRNKRRVSEKVLFTLAILGGSVCMYITMLVIRHKTRKLKFMLGIPLIALLQLSLVLFVMVNI